jgi:hypothetical protein
MDTRYRLVIRTQEGERIGTLIGSADEGFISLAASIHIRDRGTLIFETFADNPVVELLEYDCQVELWRDETLIFDSFFHDSQYDLRDGVNEIFVGTCYGHRDLLARAVIAYLPETINRTIFGETKAESLMHQVVKYNVTAEATVANGRLVDFQDIHITMETDLARGEMLPAQTGLMGKNVLDFLKETALVGGVEFDLIKTGAQAWAFRVYDTYSGTDRREDIVFSARRRNMNSATLVEGRNVAKSIVIAGGTGEGKAQTTAVRYGPDYTTEFHREHFHNDTSVAGALLQSSADKVLEEMRVLPLLTFSPAQIDGFRFGVDYFVGDLVRAEYRSLITDYTIAGASIGLAGDGLETVNIELERMAE